ncbi:MAG: hypothetical protein HC869_22050 [Rhodospirillales bacterium]|nr:hypothetical protein [Rhodospirillales bacterium]
MIIFAGISTAMFGFGFWAPNMMSLCADAFPRNAVGSVVGLSGMGAGVGGMLDYYQWTSVLRAVSAVRSYQWVYREEVRPWNVAELLLLRPEMPRSLRSCYDTVTQCLDELSAIHGGKRGECHRLAGGIASRLRFGRISDIFQSGLHEHLTELIEKTSELGDEIANLYMR